MMIENQPLRLHPHTVRLARLANGGERVHIAMAGRGEFQMPLPFVPLFQLTLQGHSIASIAMELKRASGAASFELLAKYLVFLGDEGMLADADAVKVADSLRGERPWQEPVALTPILKTPLLAWRSRQLNKSKLLMSFFFAGGLAAAGLFGLHRALSVTPSRGEADYGMALASIVLVFSLGRSAAALWSVLVSRLRGTDGSLWFVLDMVSARIETDDLSRNFEARFLGLTAGLSLLMSLVPAGLPGLWRSHETLAYLCAHAGVLLIMVETSPFSKSLVSDAIRAFYNRREARFRPATDTAPDAWLMRTVSYAKVLWFSLIGVYAVFAAPLFLKFLWSLQAAGSMVSALSGALLCAVYAAIGFSVFDDVCGRLYDPSRLGRGSIRKLWRRRRILSASPDAVDLSRLPLIRQLDVETRQILLSRSTRRRIESGEIICRQNAPDRSLFILLSGRVAVSRRLDYNRRGKVVAILQPGAVFGEAAFFLGRRRTADVRALSECEVLIIEHEHSMRAMATERSEELQLRVWCLQALMNSDVFRSIPEDALDALIFAGKRREFRAGEKVITEGEAADAFYILIQGRASVTQNFKLINRLQAGDAFGEIAILDERSLRSATVQADSDLLTVRIDAQEFWELLSHHLPLAVEIERQARRLLAKDRSRQNGRGETSRKVS